MGVLSVQISAEKVLVDHEVNLDPRHWIQRSVDPADILERCRRASAELGKALALLKQDADLDFTETATTVAHTISVRELEEQGALTIMHSRIKGHRGVVIDDADKDPWMVSARMVRDGLPDLSASLAATDRHHEPSSDDLMLEVDHSYTEPGDILVTTMRTVRAVVDETGGRTLGSGVIRVRVDRSQLEPRYVAECLAGSWNQGFVTDSIMSRASIRKLEIPLLPLSDQIGLVAAVSKFRRISEAGRRIAEESDELAAAKLEAIRFGVRVGER